MKWIFAIMILLSVVFGAFSNRMDAVSNAALEECGRAVELTLSLVGAMCMWGGVMEIAERSRLTEKLAALLSPLIRRLFRGLDATGAAARAICLNITANLLGLGNAATPLGLSAMRELRLQDPGSPQASDNMILFVVLNTASIQLVPTTTAMLRLNAGSAAPMEIMPAVWVTSALSLTVSLLVAKALMGIRRRPAQAGPAAVKPRKGG